MGQPAFDFRRLTIAERLQLVGDIWDSIAEEATAAPDALPLSDAERAELDRRLAEHEANPGAAIPLDKALERIRQRLRHRGVRRRVLPSSS